MSRWLGARARCARRGRQGHLSRFVVVEVDGASLESDRDLFSLLLADLFGPLIAVSAPCWSGGFRDAQVCSSTVDRCACFGPCACSACSRAACSSSEVRWCCWALCPLSRGLGHYLYWLDCAEDKYSVLIRCEQSWGRGARANSNVREQLCFFTI